ncbi:tetratricopeptide repeat protein [bacterium]|nr:tetratricopeptide repeat protein [bacterium]
MNEGKKVDVKQLIKNSSESFSKGNYAEAESLIREALFTAEEEGNLSDIASSLHNLGTILSRMARYVEALEYYSKALEIKEQLGEQGSSVATTLNQLAQVYYAIGQPQQAELLYEKSLSIVESLGDKNSEAITLSNLASVYASQDRLSEAEALYRRALAIQESLGSWQSAKTYNNLGNLYFELRDFEHAHLALQKSITLMKQQLGETHPDTSSVINNLAYVLAEEGKNEEALKLFSESLKNLKRVLGANHPYVKQLAERGLSPIKSSSRRS